MSEWKADDEVGKLGPGEMFEEGGMLYFCDLSPAVQASLQASAAKDEAIRQLKAELEAERAKH